MLSAKRHSNSAPGPGEEGRLRLTGDTVPNFIGNEEAVFDTEPVEAEFLDGGWHGSLLKAGTIDYTEGITLDPRSSPDLLPCEADIRIGFHFGVTPGQLLALGVRKLASRSVISQALPDV